MDSTLISSSGTDEHTALRVLHEQSLLDVGQMAELGSAIAARLLEIGASTHSIEELLGAEGIRVLYEGNPGAVRWLLRDQEHPLANFVRLCITHEPLPAEHVLAVFGAELCEQLRVAGVLGFLLEDAHLWRVLLDIRPHVLNGRQHWVFSDRDASMIAGHVPGDEHVLGVGAASVSLQTITAYDAVERVFDLGTGSGVQVLPQLGVAAQIVASDVHLPALGLAAASIAAAAGGAAVSCVPGEVHGCASWELSSAGFDGSRVSLRHGGWFAPVSGERFDRVVANPPFVVGFDEVGHVYRDSGLLLDGATALVLGTLSEHLQEEGVAHVLGSWVHTSSESARERVARWFPSHGLRVWVLERDMVDTLTYVDTWVRDATIDPRTDAGVALTQRWLSLFADEDVTHIGFGFVLAQKIAEDSPTEVVFESFSQHFEGNFGREVSEHFLRMAWLADADAHAILGAQYAVRPGLASELVSQVDAVELMGFVPVVQRLTRTEGPRWQHEIDEHLFRILSGLHPQGLALEEVVSLYALSQGVDEDELRDAVVGPIVDLVHHGLVIPSALIEAESSQQIKEET